VAYDHLCKDDHSREEVLLSGRMLPGMQKTLSPIPSSENNNNKYNNSHNRYGYDYDKLKTK
jgi:hypothetical protein